MVLPAQVLPWVRLRSPHGNRHPWRPDRSQRTVFDVGDRARHRAPLAPAGPSRAWRQRCGGGAGIGTGSNPLHVDRADRHHLDRHPQWHRRRDRVGRAGSRALRRVGTRTRQRTRPGDVRRRGDDHLFLDRRRRTRAQTPRPGPSGGRRAPSGPADGPAGDDRQAVRATAVAVDPNPACARSVCANRPPRR